MWSGLFVLIVSGGAALAIYTLPPGTSPNSAWFWIRVAVFPLLLWAFPLFARLSFLHAKRGSAIANNRVSDRELDKCHARASEPLALIGHAWVFSGGDEENEASGIADGSVQLKPRRSGAMRNIDVTARWIDIPGQSFNPGNAHSERNRHSEIIEWLLVRLLGQITPHLRRLPSSTSLQVTLSLDAYADVERFGQQLETMLADLQLDIAIKVAATNDKVSLFQVDSWLDETDERIVNLMLAIQLRHAISKVLEKELAEAGVALLLGHPSLAAASAGEPSVRVHRPAKAQHETPDETLAHAVRWGQSSTTEVEMAWKCDLTLNANSAVRSSKRFDQNARSCDLNSTVGDCGCANLWLTVALAAQQAAESGRSQLVLVQENEELIALICRKQHERP